MTREDIMTEVATITADPTEALVDRLFGESLGAFHQFTLYLGVRLGLFDALAESAGLTAKELATTASIDERYALEWLQGEAIAGLLDADSTDYSTARFSLAAGVADTLVDQVNPSYLGGLAMAIAAIGTATPSLVEAYRTGDGVPQAAYGPEMVPAQAAINRPAFVNELGSTWVPQMGDTHDRLLDASRPARVADVGCGCGWSAIELAKAFPHITVDGYDADPESIDSARLNAKAHGVDDRVTFSIVDAAASQYGDGDYDVVFLFECLHDIGRPVEALAATRAAVAADGAVIVMDERTADGPSVGDPVEMFFGVVSALWCLPQSRVVPDCEAPGTVMRPATLEAFARRAGWAGYDILPIEHPFFRFYRLVR
jgi:predicted O-methyltransferase YrrM